VTFVSSSVQHVHFTTTKRSKCEFDLTINYRHIIVITSILQYASISVHCTYRGNVASGNAHSRVEKNTCYEKLQEVHSNVSSSKLWHEFLMKPHKRIVCWHLSSNAHKDIHYLAILSRLQVEDGIQEAYDGLPESLLARSYCFS